PRSSFALILLAAKLVTCTTSLFLFFSGPVYKVKGTDHASPRYMPLSHTLALSRTSPRFNFQYSAFIFGLLNSISYLAVPEKFWASQPSSVHDVKDARIVSFGNFGPPFRNCNFQSPSIFMLSPIAS